MGGIFEYLQRMIEGGKPSSVRRLDKGLKRYRKRLIDSINETKEIGGKNWKTDVYQMLEQEKTTDEYVLAKYGIDKKGALAIIKFHDIRGCNIVLRHIEKFTGLDDKVAIEIFEKILNPHSKDSDPHSSSEVGLFWRNLDKFSIGNKFLINYFDKYEGDKDKELDWMVRNLYYKKISYDEKFISYLQKNNIGNKRNIWFLKKPLLNKKENFDENDADFINKLVNSGFGSEELDELEISGWLEENIMNFPDKSLDYSVFKIYKIKTSVDGEVYWPTRADSHSFPKFKIYEEHDVSGRKKSHTPGDDFYYYDKEFEGLYYKVYEKPGIRENNLQSMKKMSFGELLSLFVSEDKSGGEEVEDREIIEMLLSKEVKNGEIREADLSKLYRMIDDGKIRGIGEKTKKEIIKKVKYVDLIRF